MSLTFYRHDTNHIDQFFGEEGGKFIAASPKAPANNNFVITLARPTSSSSRGDVNDDDVKLLATYGGDCRIKIVSLRCFLL